MLHTYVMTFQLQTMFMVILLFSFKYHKLLIHYWNKYKNYHFISMIKIMRKNGKVLAELSSPENNFWEKLPDLYIIFTIKYV